jgi:hypothetical protein
LSRGRDKLDVPPPDHKPSNRLCDYSHTASRYRPGEKTLDAQIADGTAKVEGDIRILGKLAGAMVDFDPRFEIMAGTKAQRPMHSRT